MHDICILNLLFISIFSTSCLKFDHPFNYSDFRRGLVVCPILEGEENLRLLNFQHNLIRKIENLGMLRKLIFLDLYDNQIEEISGLSWLRSLRVLMLGKNRYTQFFCKVLSTTCFQSFNTTFFL